MIGSGGVAAIGFLVLAGVIAILLLMISGRD